MRCLSHGGSPCPWRADDLGDLVGEVVGRGPAELGRDDDLTRAAAKPDEPHPADRTRPGLDRLVIDLDAEARVSGGRSTPR
jgi:hypothetical protein